MNNTRVSVIDGLVDKRRLQKAQKHKLCLNDVYILQTVYLS